MNLPNKLTLARIIAVPVFVVLYAFELYIPAFVVFILASITDTLDGKIARKRNLVTNFGKIMDPLADKILVYAAFLMMIPKYVSSWMLIIILAREFLVAGVRTVAASEGIVIAAQMSGKIKTVLQMIAVPLLLLCPVFNDYRPLTIAAMVMLYASIVMTVISGIQYVLDNISVFKETEKR